MIFHNVGRQYFQSPAIVRVQASLTSSNTYVLTPSVAPIEGNTMFMFFGANNSPSVTSIPSGWTLCLGSTHVYCNSVFYRVAEASEPSSYTWTFSATVNGGYQFAEFSGLARVTDTTILAQTGSIGPFTSYNPGSVIVGTPGVVFSCIGKSTTTAWNPDGTWNLLSSAGMQKLAYKIYPTINAGDSITWSGASAGISHFAFLMKAKSVRS